VGRDATGVDTVEEAHAGETTAAATVVLVTHGGDQDETAAALASVVAALPGGGEARPGQATMATAVAGAIDRERHLVVQAGTGTGKSLAYLVPALRSGRRVVVTTATKALQDQLANKDLPFLAEHLDAPFTWAVVKGRSNYLCLQRLREATGEGEGEPTQAPLGLDDLAPGLRRQLDRLATWARTTETGDQAELTWSLHPKAWQAVSVTSEECPGATRCPLGEPCFAEAARRRAEAADVVVVNTHLYGVNLASGEAVLPEHDVVVVDEAHQLEDIISATAGLAIGAGRLEALARNVRAILTGDAAARLEDAGAHLAGVLAPFVGRRLPPPLPDTIADVLTRARQDVDAVLEALRSVDTALTDANQRKVRAQKAATALADDILLSLAGREGYVTFVSGTAQAPRLEVAPIDVRRVLAAVWERRVAVLTSATIPPALLAQVGLPEERTDVLDVGSPFDFATHALLYCATHLPDPRQPDFTEATHRELEALITAAGGRTLALFTSWRALAAASEALRPKLAYRILTQGELPKPELLAIFSREEASCLFATAGFFQGIDVPGPALSLVTIDRLPFPRPDDPLLGARREAVGADAFRLIDLPRAATLLAQAAGRLIRTASDRGVVAVLDPRLARANYRWDIVRALPPMRRTRHRNDVEAFLRQITQVTA
jgi:ATP-dependent DNA helicase DinG